MLKSFVVKGLSRRVVNNDGATLYRKLNGRLKRVGSNECFLKCYEKLWRKECTNARTISLMRCFIKCVSKNHSRIIRKLSNW